MRIFFNKASKITVSQWFPLILHQRAGHLTEEMDKPGCDPEQLTNTYAHFGSVNRKISGWKKIYQQFIRPLLSADRPTSLLDIGFGGGDVPFYLDELARKDGLLLHITGIETDRRAITFINNYSWPERVSFQQASTKVLLQTGHTYDIVISNHVMHHLKIMDLKKVMAEASRLARRRVVFNDIERGDLAWAAFTTTWPFFRNSFITKDGLTSIRRAFTRGELKKIAPENWQIFRRFPYRLIAVYDH